MNIRRRELVEFVDNDGVLDEELTVLLRRAVAAEVPTWRYSVLVEFSKDGLLHAIGNRHVVFDRVETAKYEIEKAYLDGRGW